MTVGDVNRFDSMLYVDKIIIIMVMTIMGLKDKKKRNLRRSDDRCRMS